MLQFVQVKVCENNVQLIDRDEGDCIAIPPVSVTLIALNAVLLGVFWRVKPVGVYEAGSSGSSARTLRTPVVRFKENED